MALPHLSRDFLFFGVWSAALPGRLKLTHYQEFCSLVFAVWAFRYCERISHLLRRQLLVNRITGKVPPDGRAGPISLRHRELPGTEFYFDCRSHSIRLRMCHRSKKRNSAVSKAIVSTVENPSMAKRISKRLLALSLSKRLEKSLRPTEARIPQPRKVHVVQCLRLLDVTSSMWTYAGFFSCLSNLNGGAARQSLTNFAVAERQAANRNSRYRPNPGGTGGLRLRRSHVDVS